MECCSLYGSPIDLRTEDIVLRITQCLKLAGSNSGAVLSDDKTYVVSDTIVLTIGCRRYQLVEYHFHHFPNTLGCHDSEHALEGEKFDAEMHHVFQEIAGDDDCAHSCEGLDLCGGHGVDDEAGALLVIGTFVRFGETVAPNDLTNIQLFPPSKYFEYDGALTGESDEGVVHCAPVRWIVGLAPRTFNAADFTTDNTKTTRCLQDMDGRLLLYGRSSPDHQCLRLSVRDSLGRAGRLARLRRA